MLSQTALTKLRMHERPREEVSLSAGQTWHWHFVESSMLRLWSIDNRQYVLPPLSILSGTPVLHPVASSLEAIQTATQYHLCPYANTDHHSFSETNVRRGAIAQSQRRSAWVSSITTMFWNGWLLITYQGFISSCEDTEVTPETTFAGSLGFAI